MLDLKRRNVVVAANVECVRCDVFQGAFDFAGGGCYGSKDYPKAKEQADYNLKYRIAVALLDDQVGPAQLQPARIQAPDAQALLARVEVRPDEHFTPRYPRELNARITICTKDQRILVKEQLGWEGGLANPMSWDRTVEKFHWLSEPFADEDLRNRLIETVQQLDTRPILGSHGSTRPGSTHCRLSENSPRYSVIRPGSYDASQDPGRRSSLVLIGWQGRPTLLLRHEANLCLGSFGARWLFAPSPKSRS